jgi:hypothetical protein
VRTRQPQHCHQPMTIIASILPTSSGDLSELSLIANSNPRLSSQTQISRPFPSMVPE